MEWVFDLDGTLIDSQEAVRRAYEAAGVRMPPEAWGKPWREWLGDEAAHRRKEALYPEFLRQYARPKALYRTAQRLRAPVLTGASGAAAKAVQEAFGPLSVALAGATAEAKGRWLAARAAGGFYVDDLLHDDPRLRRQATQWSLLVPREAEVSGRLAPQVVVLAAGESRRFAEAGYRVPKPLLPISRTGTGEKPAAMVTHVMRAVERAVDSLATEWWGWVAVPPRGELRPGNRRMSVVEVGDSRSQVETLVRVLPGLPEEAPVLVLDCDTLLSPAVMEQLLAHVMGGRYQAALAVTANLDDANMSRPDSAPHPQRFAEKRLGFSPWGVVGARAFHHVGTLLEVALKAHEDYLTPLFNHYPGAKVTQDAGEWVDWGTPERLVAQGWQIDCKPAAAEIVAP